MRRDPEVLGQLLDFAAKDLAQGGDASSICPMFRSHLSTVQKAARECASIQDIRSSGDNDSPHLALTRKSEWPDLFTPMFHCYFQYTQGDAFQDTLSDPLISALVLFCECPDLETFFQPDGTKFMFAVVLRCIGDGFLSPDSKEGVASFFSQLKVVWNIEKNALLASTTTSLMPWSADAIKDRSGSGKSTSLYSCRYWLISMSFRSPSSCSRAGSNRSGNSVCGQPMREPAHIPRHAVARGVTR